MSLGNRHAPPKASILLEALRGLGYSCATAIADIVDNSIAAQAKMVDIRFVWEDSKSRVEILDDGIGMDEQALEQAMRLGGKNPLERRAAQDLGRFGLGLKTASLSQCRSLTVASLKTDCSVLRWDLDALASGTGQDWILQEGASDEAKEALDRLKHLRSGTLVVWEKLDRIVTEGFTQQHFLDLIDVVEQHLAMVFHRYLEDGEVRIRINGRRIAGWDPFLTDHPATQHSPIERLPFRGSQVEVQFFVLPHKDRLDEAAVKKTGGPDGWTAQQGFYVYRGRRLLVSGSWLGLGRGQSWTKEEAHRLARIRIDLQNDMDEDWKIDIRKSTARPPVPLREKLTKIAEQARRQARSVFAYRGSPTGRTSNQPIAPLWVAAHTKTGTKYRISLEHPLIQQMLEDAGAMSPRLRSILRILEETVPVQRIWLDTAESREAPQSGLQEANPADILAVMLPMFRNMVRLKGLTAQAAKDRLRRTEPFQSFPDLVDSLDDSSVAR
ncbi:MAG TPA: ATP-binding protein [Fibrobacteria bacterium]|nr:ATP-binding protein [Fibrobacteria bacterium]